ncbi:MAG: hypothetical protein MJZ00_06125 [Paludibacteraceae bacterium]|nr:hypothetical protein [Paludibacteraceae bacterium]
MKIGYFGIALCAAMSATVANAQINANAFSALDLSIEDPTLGSARYSGMGGAMGAIGGVTSALKDNAASIGTSTRSDIGLTFDLYSNNDRQCSFAVSDASLLFNIDHRNSSGYMSSALAITYNRNRTFDRAHYREVEYPTGFAKDKGEDEGGTDAINFAYAGNINNMIYFGAAVGITDLRYTKQSIYNFESDYTSEDNVSDDYVVNSRGTGCNFNVGLIVQPTDFMRIGAGLQTPTLYNIEEDWSFYSLDFEGEKWDEYEFKLHTPMKFSAQLGFMLGDRANIGIDYSMRNYTRMWGEFDMKMRELEKDVKAVMKTQHTIKVGAEVNVIDGLDLRAGYAIATAPIESMEIACANLSQMGGIYAGDYWNKKMVEYEDHDTEVIPYYDGPYFSLVTPQVRHYISAGFGYSGKIAYVDFAYIHKIANEQHIEQLPLTRLDCAKIASQYEDQKNTSNHFMLSFGFHF